MALTDFIQLRLRAAPEFEGVGHHEDQGVELLLDEEGRLYLCLLGRHVDDPGDTILCSTREARVELSLDQAEVVAAMLRQLVALARVANEGGG